MGEKNNNLYGCQYYGSDVAVNINDLYAHMGSCTKPIKERKELIQPIKDTINLVWMVDI